MKIYSLLSFIVFLVIILFPLLTLNKTYSKDVTPLTQTHYDDETQAEQLKVNNTIIEVMRVSSGKIENVKLKEYLIGCVACEMPATFHEEALKAQCVASYSYLKWIMDNADNPDSDITDSSATHQGYHDVKEMKEKWGDKFDTYYKKISSAVSSVEGEYLTYNGEAIQAVFHAISPGNTSDAKEVWGYEIPYLKSVNAPGDKLSADYEAEITYTVDEIKKMISKLEGAELSLNNNELIKDIVQNKNGFVSEITVASVKTNGNEARNIFDLKSPNFNVKYENDKYIFTVTGKGHGIGMSQYSADFMARQGSDYKEILKHFYSDVKIEKD